jgi:hypothetical protein
MGQRLVPHLAPLWWIPPWSTCPQLLVAWLVVLSAPVALWVRLLSLLGQIARLDALREWLRVWLIARLRHLCRRRVPRLADLDLLRGAMWHARWHARVHWLWRVLHTAVWLRVQLLHGVSSSGASRSWPLRLRRRVLPHPVQREMCVRHGAWGVAGVCWPVRLRRRVRLPGERLRLSWTLRGVALRHVRIRRRALPRAPRQLHMSVALLGHGARQSGPLGRECWARAPILRLVFLRRLVVCGGSSCGAGSWGVGGRAGRSCCCL